MKGKILQLQNPKDLDILEAAVEVNKRGRIISQQSIQLIGDKIIATSEANLHKRMGNGSNLENFLSMASHYGSHNVIVKPTSEMIKNSNAKEKSFSQLKSAKKLDHKVMIQNKFKF